MSARHDPVAVADELGALARSLGALRRQARRLRRLLRAGGRLVDVGGVAAALAAACEREAMLVAELRALATRGAELSLRVPQ